MGRLADAWSGHVSRSPVTDLVVDALAGNPVAIEPERAFTVIFAELGTIQQHLIHLSAAVDALLETRNG